MLWRHGIKPFQIDYVGIFSDLFDSAGVSGSTDVAIMSRNYFQLLDDMLADEEENKDRYCQ